MAEIARYDVGYAKTHLSQLIARVEEGGEIVLSRAGEPVAKLVPFREPKPARVPGVWKGRVVIHAGFDELPSDVTAAFRGGST